MTGMGYDAYAMPDVSEVTVAILGGTGDQGRGLAYRWARAGQRVLIGSRSPDRGVAAAAEIAAMPGVRGPVSGADNETVCREADVIVIAVPWEGHADTVAAL